MEHGPTARPSQKEDSEKPLYSLMKERAFVKVQPGPVERLHHREREVPLQPFQPSQRGDRSEEVILDGPSPADATQSRNKLSCRALPKLKFYEQINDHGCFKTLFQNDALLHSDRQVK